MDVIRRRAYARAGLIGNPSDGYHGKTIAVLVPQYFAEVVLYEWEDLEIVPSQDDQSRFQSIQDLATDVQLHGYYGGIRLVKATIKKFLEYCEQRHSLHNRNFSIRYESTIPRAVGMAGSSGIIVATLRALMDFYELEIPLSVQPSLVLSVEREELGIQGGLQDRVVQCFGQTVYMDFSQDAMHLEQGLECGQYEALDDSAMPPLYLAYDQSVGEPTEVFHNNLRSRFDRGESDVVTAMHRFADLTEQARSAILSGDHLLLSQLIDENFDLRQSICQLPTGQLRMIESARRLGASAKFAGSGGAIVGTYTDSSMYSKLESELEAIGCCGHKIN